MKDLSSSGDHPLLQEGTRLYFEGCLALREYRRQVYDLCGKVLIRAKEDLESALGVKLSREEMRPKSYPDGLDDARWDDDEAGVYLGVSCPGGHTFWIGAHWERTGDGDVQRSAVASIEVPNAPALERLWKMVSPAGESKLERQNSPREVYTWVNVPDGDSGVLENQLREVLQTWIEVFRTAGSLRTLGKK
jgi:hypothetical protein